jgi:hypothetical protein
LDKVPTRARVKNNRRRPTRGDPAVAAATADSDVFGGGDGGGRDEHGGTGRGLIENKHPTDVESPPSNSFHHGPCTHAGTSDISYRVECLFSVTLLTGHRGFAAGCGSADVTGPIDGVGLMGYARPTQTSAGLWQRLWARAFIIASPENEHVHGTLHPAATVAVVVVDACMTFPDIKAAALVLVAARLAARPVASLSPYTEANVMVCATHTHAGPGRGVIESSVSTDVGSTINQNPDLSKCSWSVRHRESFLRVCMSNYPGVKGNSDSRRRR